MAAGSSSAAADLVGNAAHRVDQLRPAAVVDRQAHAQARVAAAQADRLVERRDRLFRQPLAAADPLHADVVLHDPRPLFDQVLLEQLQEEIEFLGRPLPVLAGEAIERDLLDAQPGTLLGHAADARRRRCDVLRSAAGPAAAPNARCRP